MIVWSGGTIKKGKQILKLEELRNYQILLVQPQFTNPKIEIFFLFL